MTHVHSRSLWTFEVYHLLHCMHACIVVFLLLFIAGGVRICRSCHAQCVCCKLTCELPFSVCSTLMHHAHYPTAQHKIAVVHFRADLWLWLNLGTKLDPFGSGKDGKCLKQDVLWDSRRSASPLNPNFPWILENRWFYFIWLVHLLLIQMVLIACRSNPSVSSSDVWMTSWPWEQASSSSRHFQSIVDGMFQSFLWSWGRHLWYSTSHTRYITEAAPASDPTAAAVMEIQERAAAVVHHGLRCVCVCACAISTAFYMFILTTHTLSIVTHSEHNGLHPLIYKPFKWTVTVSSSACT